MDLGRLWRVLLAAALVVAVIVWVVTVTVNVLGVYVLRGQPEVPAGYVTCERPDPVYGVGKAGPDCPAPGPDTPEGDILYCEAASRAEVDMSECLSGG